MLQPIESLAVCRRAARFFHQVIVKNQQISAVFGPKIADTEFVMMMEKKLEKVMVASDDHEKPASKQARLYAEYKDCEQYLTTLRNASFANFSIQLEEEAAIQANRDFSTWILTAEASDLFMHALLDTFTRDSGSRVPSHRLKSNIR